jgi:hypothetical protein
LAAENQVRDSASSAEVSLEAAMKQIDDATQAKAEKQKVQVAERRLFKRPARAMGGEAGDERLFKRPARAMGGEAGDEKPANIILSNERSRRHFLVRIEGHPSKNFKYDEGGMECAENDAKAYIKARCRALGFVAPAKFQS